MTRLSTVMACGFLLSSCAETTTNELELPIIDHENLVFAGEVPWSDVPDLLATCEVIAIAQAHNRTVTITMSDQRYYTSVQPRLDDLFIVMKKQRPCRNAGQILIATE